MRAQRSHVCCGAAASGAASQARSAVPVIGPFPGVGRPPGVGVLPLYTYCDDRLFAFAVVAYLISAALVFTLPNMSIWATPRKP